MGLGRSSLHQGNLKSISNSFSRRNEYYKFVLLNPCFYSATEVVGMAKISYQQTTSLLPAVQSIWFRDQYLNKYRIPGWESLKSSCGTGSPYLVDGICTFCIDIYDQSSQKCSACPNGTYFQVATHDCVEATDGHCSGGRYENRDGVCVCPPASPFWNGEACIDCFEPSYFDFNVLSCRQC